MAELEAQQQPADPIARLHKMSTTAGVGSQEYVAINPLAVVSLIVALISALVFFADSWVLLAVPVAAVFLAIIAFRQISNSGGTQNGTILAVIGLLLAVALGGGRVWMDWQENAATRADRESIEGQIKKFNDDILAGKYTEAYAIFAPVFRNRVPFETFESRFKLFQDPRSYIGKIKSVKSNGIIQFVEQGGVHIGLTKLIITLERPGKEDVTDRAQLNLMDTGNHDWQVFDFEWFPIPAKKQ